MVQSKAPEIVAVVVVCLTISTLFVLARIYSRFSLRNFRLDDWLLVIAWLMNIASSIIALIGTTMGLGLHTWDISPNGAQARYKAQYVAGILYYSSLPITKLSICVLYLRTVGTRRVTRWLILGLIAFMVVTGLGLTSYVTCECIPVSDYWNNQFGPNCHRRRGLSNTIFYINGASNTFTDVCIIAIVLPVISKLQLPKRAKYALYGIVCLGSIPTISAIVRMVVLSRVLNSSDPAWESADIDIWSCFESNASLICAAAPGIRPFINKIRPRFMRSTLRSTQDGKNVSDLASWESRSKANASKSREEDTFEMIPRDGSTREELSRPQSHDKAIYVQEDYTVHHDIEQSPIGV